MTVDYVMAPSATLAAAQRAIAAALKEAENLAVDVCIAVTDGAGHLLAMARMDRAPLLCVQIAQDKAYSVAAFGGLPTGDWWRLLESEPALLHGIVKTDRLIVFGGGVPLVADGRTVGRDRVSRGAPASRTSVSPRPGPRPWADRPAPLQHEPLPSGRIHNEED